MPGVRNGSSISVFVVFFYWKQKSKSSFPRVVPLFLVFEKQQQQKPARCGA